MFESMYSEVGIILDSVPASALAGAGMLLLIFGLPMVSIEIVGFGVFLGALPGCIIYMSSRFAGSTLYGMNIPPGAVLVLVLVGAFGGGYTALTARKALKFILVGVMWLVFLGSIFPGIYRNPTGNIFALIGFFAAGYFADHLFIIATSVQGAVFMILAFHKILEFNYPVARVYIGRHPATVFAAGMIIAFLGSLVQARMTGVVPFFREYADLPGPEPEAAAAESDGPIRPLS